MKKNILLLCGGGGTEHDISLISSKYIQKTIADLGTYNVLKVEIGRDGIFRKFDEFDNPTEEVEINFKKYLTGKKNEELHYAIPCIHGPPGETGEIQNLFDLIKLPYLGCNSEASTICFNKVTSKLWFNALDIPNTPFVFLDSPSQMKKVLDFFDLHGKLFIKAASQGSSVGCYQVFKRDEIELKVTEAFKFSQYVLIEKMLNARELEISTYEFEGQVYATIPGEIVCPSKFYSFEEKYNPNSKTTTEIVAQNLSQDIKILMKEYALRAFRQLKLRHLSRIDFFYTDNGDIYLNEINTFPGMTPISMFPKMMENNGHSFKEFLSKIIIKEIL